VEAVPWDDRTGREGLSPEGDRLLRQLSIEAVFRMVERLRTGADERHCLLFVVSNPRERRSVACFSVGQTAYGGCSHEAWTRE
jgi:hypothetical protein